MNVHKVCSLFPRMSDAALAALATDIKANGLREAIWLHPDGSIIDGRHRYLACEMAGVEARFRRWSDDGKLVEFVWSLNGARRHLDSGQLATVAVEMLPLLEEEARKRQEASRAKPGEKIGSNVEQIIAQPCDDRSPQSRDEAARITGTNRQYVSDAKKLKVEAPELFDKVKAGETTLVAAKREVKELKREERRQESRQRIEAVPEPSAIVDSAARFGTIVVEPPWDWYFKGEIDQLGRMRPDYAAMIIEQLLELPVPKLADVDCHLYLWMTNRSLPLGFALLDRWGFRYVTTLTWVKPRFGTRSMQNYFRGQTEHCLFGVRGSQMLKRKDLGTVIYAAQRFVPSGKPNKFRAMVESCSPGPYLRMYSDPKAWAGLPGAK